MLQAIGGLPWMAFTAWVTFYLEALGFSNAATAVPPPNRRGPNIYFLWDTFDRKLTAGHF